MKLFMENVICTIKERIKSVFCFGNHKYVDMGIKKRCSKCGLIVYKKNK